jgi:hypothetical protein
LGKERVSSQARLAEQRLRRSRWLGKSAEVFLRSGPTWKGLGYAYTAAWTISMLKS